VRLSATVEAELPQRRSSYTFSSTTTDALCSLRFRQRSVEGRNSWEESYEFDQQNRQVRRIHNGQSTVSSVPECARDPLALLYFFRQQLALGKVPAGQSLSGEFYLGDLFSAGMQPLPAQPFVLGTQTLQGDYYQITYRGVGSGNTIDVWLQPGVGRAPVALKLTLPLATFFAELE
jgi:hypothetical protein